MTVVSAHRAESLHVRSPTSTLHLIQKGDVDPSAKMRLLHACMHYRDKCVLWHIYRHNISASIDIHIGEIRATHSARHNKIALYPSPIRLNDLLVAIKVINALFVSPARTQVSPDDA
eukprot:scaffold222702_cov22-Prasinocladus_malaysianus.AAC.1